MSEKLSFEAKPKKSKVESAWQLLEEQNEAIRENSGLGYFRRVNKSKSQHNNLVNYAKIKEIQQKRDQFFAELPKVRDRINNFLLNVIKLNPDLPIWQGRDKFLTKSNYRFVPNKYVASNFESNNHKGKISNGRTNGYGELDTGFEYYKSGWEEIKMQENIDFENIIPNLTHEEYHKIFFGEKAMRNLIIGNENIQKQNQMTTFLMEGTVELLKQLNLEFDSIPDNKGYPNEIAFIKYLVDQVALRFGYSKTLKDMTMWAAMGGTAQPFIQFCKEIKTEILPNGFDIYSIEEPNLVLIYNFYENNPNKNKNSDLNSIVQVLKTNSN